MVYGYMVYGYMIWFIWSTSGDF